MNIRGQISNKIRYSGWGLISDAQSLKNTMTSFKNNVGNFITAGAPGIEDFEEVRRIHQMTPEEAASILPHLKRGDLIISCSVFPRWFQVSCPLANQGPAITKDELKRRIDQQWAALQSEIIYSDVQASDSEPIDYLAMLSQPQAAASQGQAASSPIDDYQKFFEEIVNNPNASTTEHYKNLGMSAASGDRLKKELLASGLIDTSSVSCGPGRPKEILTLTPQGRSLMK